MIRIVHLSDFHLNESTRKDWNLHIKKALIEKLNEFKSEKGISLIAFTGDLIDKGGIDYESADEAFNIFQDEIITPILTELNLSKNQFFMIPGNHDVVRDAGSKFIESGLRSDLTNRNIVSEFIEEHEKTDFSDIERVEAYSKFQKDFYKNFEEAKYESKFSSSFIIDDPVSQKKIGILCINSAWRCYDDLDSGRLIVGERHIAQHRDFISVVDYKLGLIHHPLDMLINFEEDIITSHLQKDLDTLLYGHCHESKTNIRSGLSGRLVQNMAPSGMNNVSSDSRKFSNGFTTIEYDIENNKVCFQHWRYNHDLEEFVGNTDQGKDNGKVCYDIPDPEPMVKVEEIERTIQKIKDDHYPIMTEHLIDSKNSAKKFSCIKDSYVMPPIISTDNLGENESEIAINLSEMVNYKWPLILFGNSETGKTMLLYRMVYEFIEEYNNLKKIPVYINFEEIGNRDFITLIKTYLSCTTDHANYLIQNNKIVLLIDNLNYKKYELYKSTFKKLGIFLGLNQGVKVIAVSESDLNKVAPMEFLENCEIPFSKMFILNLGSKEVRNVMEMWIPNSDSLDVEHRIDDLVKSFQSYSLPSTTMSVSLFLWSTEYHDRKPINHAVLLDIYLDILLQKLDKSNIYRDTFDFKNKSQILARIAECFTEKADNEGWVKWSDYQLFIESYIKLETTLPYDPSVIADYFIDRKIFKKSNGKIRFAYTCFYQFFIAKRMEFNSKFKNWVLEENRYFKYSKEIDYYTGLVRSDDELFKKILNRFKTEFERTDFIFDDLESKWDKHFIINPREEKKEFEPIVSKVTLSDVKDNRPSQELMDEINDRRLLNIENPKKILRKEGAVSLEVLLIIMSNVVRNSETIENKELKKEGYEVVLKYCLVWMVLYREFILDYVQKHRKMPPSIPAEIDFLSLMRNIPLSVQGGMNKHLGTFKLSPIILEKIKEDNLGRSITKSDLEKFLSVALYSDIQGDEFPKYFKKLIRASGNNPVRDFSLIKLVNYYYKRTKPDSDGEKLYLDLIAELRIKSLKLPAKAKERIMKSYKDVRSKYLN